MYMEEQWKDIKGYEGLYQVSNLGRIKSLSHKVYTKDKRGYNYQYFSKEKILRNIKNGLGYVQVYLFKNGIGKIVLVHRIVALNFIENPENKKQVNHKDGDKSNPKLENLEWVTVSENGLHGYRQLGYKAWHKGNLGKNTPTSKPVIQKNIIGKIIKEWDCMSDAWRLEGFRPDGIGRVCRGEYKTYKGFIWEYKN